MYTHTYKLTIEYDGTRFHGWQEQYNARTIAGEIRGIASEILQEKIDFGGAGRTDSGVHALAQVAHLRTNKLVKPLELKQAINDRLPPDINILRLEPAPAAFHSRHDALARYYVYQIATERTAFGKRYVWWVKDRLDLRAMRQASEHFVGLHDFVHFSQPEEPATSGPKFRRARPETTRVDVHQISLDAERRVIYFRVGASHFLWKMVRRMVGALVEVGRGNLKPIEIPDLMRQGSPLIAGWTAPPSGLFLERIEYPGDPAMKFVGAPRINTPL